MMAKPRLEKKLTAAFFTVPWVINGLAIELMSIALLLYYLAHESGAGRCSKGRARDGSLQESRVGTLELLYKL